MRLNKKSGFTLLEIIIVVLILAVLASIAMPTFTGMVQTSRENAALNSAKNICQQIGAASTLAGSLTIDSPYALDIEGFQDIECQGEADQVINCTAMSGALGYESQSAFCTWAN